jgi:DNA-binding protein VF530
LYPGNIGSSKTAADAIAQEAERSAANTLKSKAIKEAKRLAKLEGKPASKARKVETKVKPTRPAASYGKKSAAMADLDDILMNDFKAKETEEVEDMDMFEQLGMMDENRRSKIPDKSEDSGPKRSTAVPVKVAVVAPAPVAVAAATPVQNTAEPVYVKLKRRVVEEEEDSESEEESDTLGDLDRLMSLEDLGNRMDQLYGDSDSDPESDPVSNPTEVKVVKGSDSKNPIKWRNGRLVNDKDRLYGEIRSQAVSGSSSEEEGEGEGEEDSDDSDSGSEGREGTDGQSARLGAKKKAKSSSKKVTVELTGVTMKLMLEHLETSIGFDGLFEETNLRCFSVKPSVNSSLKVLRQLPLEWARKKIEYLYIQSKKRQ